MPRVVEALSGDDPEEEEVHEGRWGSGDGEEREEYIPEDEEEEDDEEESSGEESE